jgi:hypothetical protein
MMPACSPRLADDVAGGVLQVHQWRAALAAGLDEVRGLGGAGGIEASRGMDCLTA